MDALPTSSCCARARWTDVIEARAAHPGSQLLGGGTDLIVNIRRGIVAPPVLIDIERRRGAAHHQGRRARARDRRRRSRWPSWRAHPDVHRGTIRWWRRRRRSIAGPTHRNMGTVGGNLCLDTRCIFYNQSEWWRSANNHCLKTTGDICHVAPKSRGVCFATFSGDLAPALLTLGAEVDLARTRGPAHAAAAASSTSAMRARTASTEAGDGKHFLALRPGEFVAAVRATTRAGPALGLRQDPHPPLDRVSGGGRRGGAAPRRRHARRPARRHHRHQSAPGAARGHAALCGGALDARVFKGLDDLVRDQIMSMKTTFTPGHYRRRVAGVLARRLVQRLFDAHDMKSG